MPAASLTRYRCSYVIALDPTSQAVMYAPSMLSCAELCLCECACLPMILMLPLLLLFAHFLGATCSSFDVKHQNFHT